MRREVEVSVETVACIQALLSSCKLQPQSQNAS